MIKIHKLKYLECVVTSSESYINARGVECWRRIEKISRTDRVRNELLHGVKKERNILRKIKRKKIN